MTSLTLMLYHERDYCSRLRWRRDQIERVVEEEAPRVPVLSELGGKWRTREPAAEKRNPI
jgi:hypothetical protein